MTYQHGLVSRTGSLLTASLIAAWLAAPAHGDAFTWTGGAGNVSWSDANNWVNDTAGGVVSGFPGLTDTVTIPDGVSALAGGGSVGGMTIGSTGQFTLTTDDLTVAGVIDNGSVFSFQNSGFSNPEILGLSGQVMLTGGGEVVLTSAEAQIVQAVGTGGLVNVDNTIRGFGVVSAEVENDGLIRVEGGMLYLGTTDNSGGSVEIASNRVLRLQGELSGGTLAGEGGFIEGATFRDLTVVGTVSVTAGDSSMSGAIVNTGTITFQNSGFSNAEILGIVDQVTLTGGGEVVLNNHEAQILQTVGTGGLVNVDNTIRGFGLMKPEIVNQGLIRAEGGTLQLGATDNSGGAVEIASDGRLQLLGELTGGTVQGEAGGLIYGVGVRDITVVGTVAVGENDLKAAGTIQNTGTITFQNSGFSNAEYLGLEDQVTLTGGGVVVLNHHEAQILQTVGTGGLVNVDNTIRATGNGFIGVDVENSATIEVMSGVTLTLNGTIHGGALDIESGALVNGGLLSDVTILDMLTVGIDDRPVEGVLTNFGTITFQNSGFANPEILGLHGQVTLNGGGQVTMTSQDATINQIVGVGGLVNVDNTITGQGSINADLVNQATVRATGGRLVLGETDNSGGAVFLDAGSLLRLNGALTGGSVTAEDGSRIEGATLVDTDLYGLFRVTINELAVKGSITNHGEITFENSGFANPEMLQLDGQVVLDGGGVITLNSADARLAQVGGTTGGLVNVDNTIRTLNRGTIDVDVDNQSLIDVLAGARLTLTGTSTLSGGTIQIGAGGIIEGGLIEDFTLLGTLTVPTNERLVGGTIENTGMIVFQNSGFSNSELLQLHGEVTLTGGGEVVLNSYDARIVQYGETMGGLDNRDNTIRGFGYLDVDIENGGLIRAEGGRLTASGDITRMSGAIEVANASEFEFNGGTLEANSVILEGTGVFDFNGDVFMNRYFEGDFTQDQGAYRPSGRRSAYLVGDYRQASVDATLWIDMWSYIQGLDVSGDVDLMGALSLVDHGFTPELGESYAFLVVDGVLSGTFAGLPEGASVGTYSGIELFITYAGGDGNDVALYSVPEPASLALLGLSGLLVTRRRAAG